MALQLGSNIRARRGERGLTQVELAKRINVGQAFLSHIERGHQTGSLATIVAIAKELGTTVDALVQGAATDDSMGAQVTRLLEAVSQCTDSDVVKLIEIAEQMAAQQAQATRSARKRSPRR